VRWYKKAADQGVGLAFNDIGFCYRYGNGVPSDFAKSLIYYSKATELGVPQAMYNLGRLYSSGGPGLPRNMMMAFQYYSQAAQVGDRPLALLYLGKCYLEGSGTPKDSAKAFHYLHRAAVKGECSAQYHTALCYQKGEGTTISYSQYVHWLKTAADNPCQTKEALDMINNNKFADVRASIYSQEWPLSFPSLNTRCITVVTELLCALSQCYDIPLEIGDVLVQHVIVTWDQPHLTYVPSKDPGKQHDTPMLHQRQQQQQQQQQQHQPMSSDSEADAIESDNAMDVEEDDGDHVRQDDDGVEEEETTMSDQD